MFYYLSGTVTISSPIWLSSTAAEWAMPARTTSYTCPP